MCAASQNPLAARICRLKVAGLPPTSFPDAARIGCREISAQPAAG
jgi:hypothetical protein